MRPIGIILLIICLQPILVSAEKDTIYTRITSLDYEKTTGELTNYSYFQVQTSVEVWNTAGSDQEVMIDEHVPHLDLFPDLENGSILIESYLDLLGWSQSIQLTDVGYIDIEPGLHQYTETLDIRVNISDLSDLPNGEYKFNYHFSYSDDKRYNWTINVDDGQITHLADQVPDNWGETSSRLRISNTLIILPLVLIWLVRYIAVHHNSNNHKNGIKRR